MQARADRWDVLRTDSSGIPLEYFANKEDLLEKKQMMEVTFR